MNIPRHGKKKKIFENYTFRCTKTLYRLTKKESYLHPFKAQILVKAEKQNVLFPFSFLFNFILFIYFPIRFQFRILLYYQTIERQYVKMVSSNFEEHIKFY